jgi:hypothetical protein
MLFRTTCLLIATIAGSTLTLLPATSLAQAQSQPVSQPAQFAPTTETLPIKRITLYRSGVGSFERRGLVDGDATVQLRFGADQINDILKSMVVLDLSGQGRVGGISYASKEPLARRLASFGVNIADEPALGTILGRLRGSKVAIDSDEGAITGTILGGETRPEASGNAQQPINVPYLNILTDGGIRSVNLTKARAVRLLDAGLREELDKALTALAEYRQDTTKTVDVSLAGGSGREVVIAYVQESPVWKTSYRLVLPDARPSDAKPNEAGKEKPADTFTVQGWAIVENTTDEDWNDVTLSLVAGRPVSFRMDLYEPLYVYRPEIPVPTVPGVMPRAYEGGIADADGNAAELALAGNELGSEDYSGGFRMKAGRPGAGGARGTTGNQGVYGDIPEPAAAMAPGAPPVSGSAMSEYGATSQARAVEAGEVFQFELQHPVTVARQRSAMLPILAAPIEGRRVSIFTPGDNTKHPMRGVELTNTTGSQLMPGPISVFDGGAYAGDAQINHVPLADKRLLAYTVDLDVVVTPEQKYEEDVRKIRIVRGLIESTTLRRNSTTYTIENKDQKRTRSVIIEHPRMPGFELVAPAGGDKAERTDSAHRLEVELDAAKSGKLTTVQERTDATSIALTSMNLNTLMAYVKNGKASDAVLKAFQEAGRRQGLIIEATRRIEALENERRTITEDQTRVRSNMGSIDRASTLYANYMKKLTEQETRLDQIVKLIDEGQTNLAQTRSDLENFLANLNVE